MTFSTVPIQISGGTYQSRSRPLSTQRTINFYPQISEQGKEQFVLHSFPGQTLISSVDDGLERGQHVMNEVQYRIVSDRFYRVDKAGNHLQLGTVTGGDRCIMADDGDNLVIVSDKIYVWTDSTATFQENTNANLKGVLSVTIINNQFIYTTAELSFMAEPGDPFDVSGLNGVGAESNPDKLVRDYAFNQTIYRFGQRTTEPWYNSGVGTPPIERIEGQQISVGLIAVHSVANTDRAVYWLGDDKCIYRISGGISERVSDDGLSNTIERMTTISDAFSYAFTLQGDDFYLITFPSESRTFVINESLGKSGWFELSSGTQGASYSGTSLVEVYSELRVCNKGKLLKLDLDNYTQDSDTMLRQRVTRSFSGQDLGLKGNQMLMSRLEFIMETGVGLITGQGVLPRMRVETSIDGGRSFAHSAWVELGRTGQNTLRAELYNMMQGTDFVFRLSISDPVAVSIYGGAIDVRLMGR